MLAELPPDVLRKRRADLSRDAALVGIDFVEVDSAAWAVGRLRLLVHFIAAADGAIKQAVPPGLGPSAFRVAIGSDADAPDLQVLNVEYPSQDPNALVVSIGDDAAQRLDGNGQQHRVLTLELRNVPRVDRFFRRVTFTTDPPPEGATARDGRPLAAPPLVPLEIDYLARDYTSFRQSILDQLALLAPGWTERNPADLGMVLVELLAYAADFVSYHQDAVATEAYLGTARQRISVRRHARLLDYALHEGCNARCWIHLETAEDDVHVPRGTQILGRVGTSGRVAPDSPALDEAIRRGAHVYETMVPVALFRAHNRIQVYTWGSADWSLPRGATTSALVGHLPNLRAGDVLIFEELRGPESGDPADADPGHRHAVRLTVTPRLSVDVLYGASITEVEWASADALPFELPVASRQTGDQVSDISIAHGNVVLADHGRTHPPEALPIVPRHGRYRPRLRIPDLVWAEPFDGMACRGQPARDALLQKPIDAVPALRLNQVSDARNLWRPRRDLLRSDRFARDFVVEVGSNGHATLRFGDDTLGRRPPPDARLEAVYRTGNGPRGDIDADALVHVVTFDDRIIGARNPLPSLGSEPAESVAHARASAPRRLHQREVCATEADYAATAREHPAVRGAVAELRWTGAWPTVVLYVHRRGGLPLDQEFIADLDAFLRPRLLVGTDLRIRGPRFVPLEVGFAVDVDRHYRRAAVRDALLDTLGPADLPDGRRGWFHPDNFSFGDAVYLSPLVAQAMRVEGVASIDWLSHGRLRRWGAPASADAAVDVVTVSRLEIAQMLNDQSAPHHGILLLDLQGGAV